MGNSESSSLKDLFEDLDSVFRTAIIILTVGYSILISSTSRLGPVGPDELLYPALFLVAAISIWGYGTILRYKPLGYHVKSVAWYFLFLGIIVVFLEFGSMSYDWVYTYYRWFKISGGIVSLVVSLVIIGHVNNARYKITFAVILCLINLSFVIGVLLQ
jgi:hypothetical protein